MVNINQHLASEDEVLSWSRHLGLAVKSLFAPEANAEQHFALLNGRRASFVCSLVDDVDPHTSRSWQWSADLAHHVFLLRDEVRIRSGRDDIIRRFSRRSVEAHLDEFFAYLDSPSHPALPDVVSYLLNEFEQIWALLPQTEDRGHIALAVFLTAIQAASQSDPNVFMDTEWRQKCALEFGFTGEELHQVVDIPERVARWAAGLASRLPLNLKLHSDLVLRHAGGRLFQEAHGYLESVQPDLFGGASVTRIIRPSSTAAYYTPVSIARFVAEAAVEQYGRLPDRLIVADFACGSAVFLAEILHVLDRVGYNGEVTLVGRDISPAAIVMARAAITGALRGIHSFRVHVDIRPGDALDPISWVPADIILMNPPFRSWEEMTPAERDWVRMIVGGPKKGRPDLCVGFIEKAIDCLKPGGVLATLLPAGVLSAQGLSGWRHRIAERAQPALVAVLGEYGLFKHALVNIGVLIARRDYTREREPIIVAWAAPEEGAASHVLRALRKKLFGGVPTLVPDPSRRALWTITEASPDQWLQRPSWLPRPNLIGNVLAGIRARFRTTVGDLFDVKQGIRTGAKNVFVLPEDEYANLPRDEQRFFAPAVENNSFVNGALQVTKYVFIGDDKWSSEDDVKGNVPCYYALKLKPAEDALRKRKGIDPDRWWRLTWSRSWMFNGVPRLVSKSFGLVPAFARDYNTEFAIVQGNAWIPKRSLSASVASGDIVNVLDLYWWLLNSNIAIAIFSEYCPHVAGGQLDLGKMYVGHVPMPNLAIRTMEDPMVLSLVREISAEHPDSLPPLDVRDAFAAACFGTSLRDWPI